MTPILAVLLAAALMLLIARPAGAHGGDPPLAPPAMRGRVPAALHGAESFLERLAARARGILTAGQMEALDEAARHLGFARMIGEGRHPDAGPEDAAYNRWLAEKALLDLLDTLGPIWRVDFQADPSPSGTDQPLAFDGQTALLVARVEDGEGPEQFALCNADLVLERYVNPVTVTTGSGGVTWVLFDFDQVPAGPSSVTVAFRRDGEDTAHCHRAFTICPGPMGNLAADILDEAGEPTPVLLRLTALPSGRVWQPDGALDLRPMLNDVTGLAIYGPGRAYTIPIPGKFAGPYWVVPGPFETALPAGEWEAWLWHGTEYIPVRQRFDVKPGEWTRLTIHLERWERMADRGWYSGDDHVHARLMGSEDADKLMAFTRAMDIHVSNILEMGDSMRTYYAQRGFGPGFRVRNGDHWLVPGQEDPRSMLGHNIGMNITGLVRDLDRYLLLDWIADEVHRQGGLFGQTHVGENACEAHRGMALLTPRGLYDFYSVLQWRIGTELFYDFLDLGFRLTASAGSDMPYGGMLGGVRLYAHTGTDGPFTPDAWFDAVKAGRTFATNGVLLAFDVDGALPGAILSFDHDATVKVRAQAWGLQGESEPGRLEIVSLGAVVASADAAEEGVLELEEGANALGVGLELPVGHGRWVAARATGLNGSQAHTTPVYLERSGFRHWNTDRAEAVIGKELAVLDEIEGVVAAALEMRRKGSLHQADFWNRRIADQAAGVRDRITIARGLYEELRATLRNELAIRSATSPKGA